MVAVRAAHTSHHEPCCSQSNARTLPVDRTLLPATRASSRRSVQWHVCAVAHASACVPDEAAVNALSLTGCSATLACTSASTDDHTCGRGATARPKAQLAALHLPQHRHGGGVRARFTLPSGTASAAVSQPLALFAPGLHSRMQHEPAASASMAASAAAGVGAPKVVLRFVIGAIRHAPYQHTCSFDQLL